MTKDYDFAGYVTKNDIHISDGTIVRHNAFAEDDGREVTLVWNHQHDSPDNVIGKVKLVNMSDGVYGYGMFNNSTKAVSAREGVKHGDINAMSIGANRVKRDGHNIIHGRIFEVSLVLAGANPGATIDEVVTHGENDSSLILYTDEILHSVESEPSDPEPSIDIRTRLKASMIRNKLTSKLQ